MPEQNPRALAASFALAVTEAPRHGFSWIAKNGDESPFRVLQQLLPEVGPCRSIAAVSCTAKNFKSLIDDA
jgi:hypothetical protein